MLERLIIALTLITSSSQLNEAALINVGYINKPTVQVEQLKLEEISVSGAIEKGEAPYTDIYWPFSVSGFGLSGEASLKFTPGSNKITADGKVTAVKIKSFQRSYEALLDETGKTICYKQLPDHDLLGEIPHLQYLFEYLLTANFHQKQHEQIPTRTYEGIIVESKGYVLLSAFTDKPVAEDMICEKVEIRSESNDLKFGNLERATLCLSEGTIKAFKVDLSVWGFTYTLTGIRKDTEKQL